MTCSRRAGMTEMAVLPSLSSCTCNLTARGHPALLSSSPQAPLLRISAFPLCRVVFCLFQGKGKHVRTRVTQRRCFPASPAHPGAAQEPCSSAGRQPRAGQGTAVWHGAVALEGSLCQPGPTELPRVPTSVLSDAPAKRGSKDRNKEPSSRALPHPELRSCVSNREANHRNQK